MADKLKSVSEAYRKKQIDGTGDNSAKGRAGEHRAHIRLYEQKQRDQAQAHEVKKGSGYKQANDQTTRQPNESKQAPAGFYGHFGPRKEGGK